MVTGNRSHKVRVWICTSFVLLLFIYLYTNSGTTSLLKNSLKPALTTLLSSLYSHTSNDTVDELLIYGKPLKSTPSEAFVTFANNNPNYLALLINVLDSVHYFSTRPIIAYGIDVDLNLNTTKYPRLIKRRLDRAMCGEPIFFCKIYAIVDSKIDYGVHIDADSVVNYNIDILFDVVRKWPYPLPLAPRHPGDPVNYRKFLTQFGLDLNSRTIPYTHGQFLWNYRAYPFFQQALTLMRQRHFVGANFDETAINILLWKAKATHTLCKIDSFVTYMKNYESQKKICKEYCHTAFIIFHGSKIPTDTLDTFERVKNHSGLPFIQTPNEGFHYLNETQYTCCYPDSKPSPIHPLLCQHTT